MLTSQRHRDRHVDAQASEAYICGFLTIWIPVRGAMTPEGSMQLCGIFSGPKRGADIVNYLGTKVDLLYTYLKP